uniref:Uncharacterized protein n=1 Tax=Arion vulgaris TaxID=1028688 RepID=A0A0B7AHI9_9EUPU
MMTAENLMAITSMAFLDKIYRYVERLIWIFKGVLISTTFYLTCARLLANILRTEQGSDLWTH